MADALAPDGPCVFHFVPWTGCKSCDRLKAAAQAPAQPSPTMADALAAGDGTLHGAVDHWQEQALAGRVVMQQALDALRGVRSNMQQNAPHLSGKVWGDADAAIAALSSSLGQVSEPRDG